MPRARTAAAFWALLLGLLAAAPRAHAQSSLADTITFLMTNESVVTGNAAGDRLAAQAASQAIGRAILASLSTLPVTSSTGSFTFRLNPELGTVEQTDRTFGPFFVERALTVGRGQASAGISFQHFELTTLDGHSLRDGSLVTTANQFVGQSVPFDVDRLRLNVAADVATVYGAFGLTDRLDISAALPLVSLRIDGTRVDTYRGQDFEQAKASAIAVGAADAVVRLKYQWTDSRAGRVSTAVDLRLPTGRAADLLGAGSVAIRVSELGSLDARWWSAHGNLGFSVGGFASEISYGGALAVAPTRHVTLSGEVVGRWIDGVGQLATTTAPDPALSGVNTLRLSSDSSWRHVVTFVSGLKWNVSDTWVVLANVSVPVTDAGLTSPATPFFGIDYAFGSIF